MPVKKSYFEGIACLSFISSVEDESDVLASSYLFWVEQDIDSYENLSDTENEVRNIKTFLGKSEPGCKQYFTNIWEERVDEYWQLKYSEIWTCLSDINESIADDLHLNAFPNPFQQSIEFSFILDKPEDVNLAVFDILGNKLTTIVDDRLTLGNHLYKWNGNAYPNGMYFVSLQTNSTKILRKITLVK